MLFMPPTGKFWIQATIISISLQIDHSSQMLDFNSYISF